MTIDRHLEQRRQKYLESLYLLDGRDTPTHPRHATYTALYTERVAFLHSRDVDELLAAINPAS
jgi:hypothetical protein